MTTLTMRLVKGDFIVTGPDVEPMKFRAGARPRTGVRRTIPARRSPRSGRAASARHPRNHPSDRAGDVSGTRRDRRRARKRTRNEPERER
jgi:hypothetical protein